MLGLGHKQELGELLLHKDFEQQLHYHNRQVNHMGQLVCVQGQGYQNLGDHTHFQVHIIQGHKDQEQGQDEHVLLVHLF